jgi:hypothetical protein
VGPPVHRFSRPTVALSSSLDALAVEEDVTWLMGQSVPPSPPGFLARSASPVPPLEEVVSRIFARRTGLVIQKEQVSASTRGLNIAPTRQPERPETSMSPKGIVDILDDVCAR